MKHTVRSSFSLVISEKQIAKKHIHAAKNMLRFSDYIYLEIDMQFRNSLSTLQRSQISIHHQCSFKQHSIIKFTDIKTYHLL